MGWNWCFLEFGSLVYYGVGIFGGVIFVLGGFCIIWVFCSVRGIVVGL